MQWHIWGFYHSRLLLLIIINIFIVKIHILILIVKLKNKYALKNEYIFITEKSAGGDEVVIQHRQQRGFPR